MAGIRIFVSSTCYDLSMLRGELRNFMHSFGYEPIMSDYADILYDPRFHTHTSCIDEVCSCDMLVVIIGSRYGGKGVPEAIKRIDWKNFENFDEEQMSNCSITQLEILKALENEIPVYTFIERDVYHDHAVYEKNKDSENIDSIIFPSIDNQQTAKYIFEFIDFIRKQSKGNSFFPFEKIQDIEEILKKQWSAYFHRLLDEEKYRTAERKRIDSLNEQFEDLKAAILSSIEAGDQREIAQGIVRYRRLADFLFSFPLQLNYLSSTNNSLDDILRNNLGIAEIIDKKTLTGSYVRMRPICTFLVKDDKTFYACRWSMDIIESLKDEWESFKQLNSKSRGIILETLKDLSGPIAMTRYYDETFEEYLGRREQNIPPQIYQIPNN